VGSSATRFGLAPGDVVVLVDGVPALRVPDLTSVLAKQATTLTVVRDGTTLSLATQPAPAPWDFRYLFLVFVGAAFYQSGVVAVHQARHTPRPGESYAFAGFALAVAIVLEVTPAPPWDAFYRTSTLLEELARALFPALLLQLVLTFPRRARHVPLPLLYLPPAALFAYALRLYLLPQAGQEATELIERLDALQGLWMSLAAVAGAARLLYLSRKKIDLLTEKQIRFLLLGTAVGLVPLCLLDLVPRLLGTTVPVLSSLSLLPLALAPLAFLAALTRYRLWDVEVLGRETVALLGAVFVGAGFFTAGELVLAHPVSIGIPYLKGSLQTAAGLLMALSFVPVRRGLSAALAKLQYRDAWKEREGLLSLVRELPLPRRLPEVEQLLVTRIASGLGVAPTALLTVREDGTVDGSRVDGGGGFLLADLPASCRARPTRLSLSDFSPATLAVTRLRRAGFRTLAPLAVSGRLLALFAVGDRDGRVPLSLDDQELLETILAPAALALDHARLYDELERQADRYRSLKEFHEDVVSGSAAAIAATDHQGRFTSVNPAFAQLVGKREAELLTLHDAELFPPQLMAAVVSAGRVEVDFGSGSRIVDAAVSPFPGALPGSMARVWVLHDATETTRLERALADRERLAALGTLSAGVAHEVNTPLTGVASFARLLMEEIPEEDPRRRLVEKIERQAFRASRLVGSLLDLARGRPRDLTPLDPAALAREAASALEDELAARGLGLEVAVPEGLPQVTGHADALVQVLVNLLKNGMEAACVSSDGQLGLAVRAEDGGVFFDVADNGPGMTEEQAGRVFEPFFSTKTAQGGTGLGLAIARDIIRAHGGTLSVESAPGRGSRFSVRLPAATGNVTA